MRNLLIAALMASAAATPALAAPTDREQDRAERQQEREDRKQDREERREARPKQQQQQQIETQVHVKEGPARVDATGRANRQDVETIRNVRQADRVERIEDRQQARELRQAERRLTVPVVSNTPRIGTQPPARVEPRHSSPTKWSENWKKDKRYDWWNWRNRNRLLFNLGYYYDPFGWGYQRYDIGYRMWPSYYNSSFWLNDPWQYRLPYAPPGYRWIRYYDDAILIDTWDGRVVDVIYSFFW